jgi:hypothetical protein
VVRVGDAGLGERALEALCVRPGVLAPADASPLTYVDEESDVRAAERVEEAVDCPAVDADRRQPHQAVRVEGPRADRAPGAPFARRTRELPSDEGVLIGEHTETGSGQEEVYVVVLDAHATFEIDGETVDAPAGTFVSVRPE